MDNSFGIVQEYTEQDHKREELIENAIALVVDGVVSNCCGANVYNDDICGKCGEHCEPIKETD